MGWECVGWEERYVRIGRWAWRGVGCESERVTKTAVMWGGG